MPAPEILINEKGEENKESLRQYVTFTMERTRKRKREEEKNSSHQNVLQKRSKLENKTYGPPNLDHVVRFLKNVFQKVEIRREEPGTTSQSMSLTVWAQNPKKDNIEEK